MNLAWTLNRLSAMSGREVGYRIRQKVQSGLEQLGLGAAKPVPPAQHLDAKAWLSDLPSRFNIETYTAAADRVLDGRFDVFALKDLELGFPPRWNCDPKTRIEAPLAFGKSLNYRDETLVGDIKYLWEPSRHLQLLTLTQAWRLSGNAKYLAGCRTLLDSWFEQCPYRMGVHWTSSLEHAIRLLNWSFAWHLLGGHDSPLYEHSEGKAFRQRWLTSIYQHCHFIAGHLSRFSSANNHLLGELAGLFVAATTWPLWPQSPHWQKKAHQEFAREALKQNGADGVNLEQATWYHHEVADLMLLTGLVARANRCDFHAAYWSRLETMLEFIASIMDSGGHVPSIGDADDGFIVRFDPTAHFDVYRSLLATGAVLFNRAEFKLKAGSFDDKSRWLLGDPAAERFAALQTAGTQLPVRLAFPEGGYYILGAEFETPREVRIVADAAPLGYLSIAAHGHADALSFTLSAGGKEMLIDPGTFAYHTQKKWRDYFRGTSAHNTLRIDGFDQSVPGGNFLWISHARTAVESFAATDGDTRLVAAHDGYRRLKDPVHHRRELHYDRATATLTITDDLTCEQVHEIELFWHFAEHCRVSCQERTLVAVNNEVTLTLLTSPALQCSLHTADEQAPLGWLSRRFDERVPCTTMVARGTIEGSTRLVTQVRLEFAVDASGDATRQPSTATANQPHFS